MKCAVHSHKGGEIVGGGGGGVGRLMAIRPLELHSFLFYNNLFYQNVDGQKFKKLPKKTRLALRVC